MNFGNKDVAMDVKRSLRRPVALIMIVLMSLTTTGMAFAQGGSTPTEPVSTSEVLASEQVRVDRAELKAMLATGEVQEKLASLGVDPEQVEERIDNLTAEELSEFNQALDESPAGAGVGGVVGVIVLFLLVFIITDMLCATNVYNFVNCIN
jgi:hypothetical protein